jgi:hypothetical protein
MCMVWSQLANIRTPPIVTTDFVYIRFIGDRTIQEKDFGKIQKDRMMLNCLKLKDHLGIQNKLVY